MLGDFSFLLERERSVLPVRYPVIYSGELCLEVLLVYRREVSSAVGVGLKLKELPLCFLELASEQQGDLTISGL